VIIPGEGGGPLTLREINLRRDQENLKVEDIIAIIQNR
jgi:hypothetical protein